MAKIVIWTLEAEETFDAVKIYPNRIDLLMFWDTRQNPRKKKF